MRSCPPRAVHLPLVDPKARRSMPFRAKAPPPGKFCLPSLRCSAAASSSGRQRRTTKHQRERDEKLAGTTAVYQGRIQARKTHKIHKVPKMAQKKWDTKAMTQQATNTCTRAIIGMSLPTQLCLRPCTESPERRVQGRYTCASDESERGLH